VLVEEFDNTRVRAQAVIDGAFNVMLASTFVGAARSLDNGLIRYLVDYAQYTSRQER
jgi:hypothetical protein